MRKNLTNGCTHITKSEVGNHHNTNHHNKKNMCLFLVSVIATGLLTATILSVQVIVSAHAYPPPEGSISSSTMSNSTSNKTEAIQMGICVVGVNSPCNGDSVQ
jgi:hypothetical protein